MRVFLIAMCLVLTSAQGGCSGDLPTSSTDGPELATASLGKIDNAPAQSGPIVTRTEDIFGWTIVDWDKDLTVYAGFDIHQFCDWVVGGYQGDLPVETASHVFRNPGGGDRLMIRAHGENLTTSVWPTAHDWRDACFNGYYDDVPPVALGYSTAKSQDNGGAFPDTPNTNSFGVKFNGKLETPMSEKVNMTAQMQCVWSGPDEDRSPNHPNEYPWVDGSCISTVNLSGHQ